MELGGQSGSIFISDFPRRVRLLCVLMESERQVRKQAEEEVAQTQGRKRDLGEASTLQQETLQSAFNHNRPLLPLRPSPQTERRTAAGAKFSHLYFLITTWKNTTLSVRSDSIHGHTGSDLLFTLKRVHTECATSYTL